MTQKDLQKLTLVDATGISRIETLDREATREQAASLTLALGDKIGEAYCQNCPVWQARMRLRFKVIEVARAA